MIKIQKTFFCDNIEISQFNKRNFIGVILAKEILISNLPYKFLSNIVVIGETTENCQITFELSNKNGVLENKVLDIELGKQDVINGVEISIPVQFNINNSGELYIKIFYKGQNIFSDVYEFIMGDSPYLNQHKHLSNSGIFNKEEDIKLIKEVISLATTSIAIIDNYIRDSFQLRKLLESIIDFEISILVFTLSRYKKELEKDASLFVDFPNLELYFTTPTQDIAFHDRYIIVDTTEYYNFGASLNDISLSKISGYKKITSKKEIEFLNNIILKLIEEKN